MRHRRDRHEEAGSDIWFCPIWNCINFYRTCVFSVLGHLPRDRVGRGSDSICTREHTLQHHLCFAHSLRAQIPHLTSSHDVHDAYTEDEQDTTNDASMDILAPQTDDKISSSPGHFGNVLDSRTVKSAPQDALSYFDDAGARTLSATTNIHGRF